MMAEETSADDDTGDDHEDISSRTSKRTPVYSKENPRRSSFWDLVTLLVSAPDETGRAYTTPTCNNCNQQIGKYITTTTNYLKVDRIIPHLKKCYNIDRCVNQSNKKMWTLFYQGINSVRCREILDGFTRTGHGKDLDLFYNVFKSSLYPGYSIKR
jgi:hypothetical protein